MLTYVKHRKSLCRENYTRKRLHDGSRVLVARHTKLTNLYTVAVSLQGSYNYRWFCNTSQPAHRAIVEEIATKFNITNPDHYNKLSSHHFQSHPQGISLLQEYGSLYNLLKTNFPEKDWKPWQFPHQLTVEFWSNPHNRKEYLTWLQKRLGYTTLEDWYRVSKTTFYDNYGTPPQLRFLSKDLLNLHSGAYLFKLHRNSAVAIVIENFPEHEWLEWKFENKTPKGFWDNIENQRRYWKWLCNELNLEYPYGLYELPKGTIRQHYGATLLAKFKDSVPGAVMAAFPEYEWIPWKFRNVPSGFWNLWENRKAFFDWAGQQLKIKSMDEWYAISAGQLEELRGGGLLAFYNGSVSAALHDVYREHDWLPWRFNNAPHRWWKDPKLRLKFCDYVASQLGFKSMDDWYSLMLQTFCELGGRGMLEEFESNLYKVVCDAYPHHGWQSWRFLRGQKDNNSSSNPADREGPSSHEVRTFLESLAQKAKLRINERGLEEWYSFDINNADLTTADRISLNRLGGLLVALQISYPEHEWDLMKFVRRTKSRSLIQKHLSSAIISLFPLEEHSIRYGTTEEQTTMSIELVSPPEVPCTNIKS